jgi:hypothetical protein
MFFSGATEVVGATGTPCCSAGAFAVKEDGISYSRPDLPSVVDLAVIYQSSWQAPDGECPFPHYQTAYICTDSFSYAPNVGRTDTTLPSVDAPPAEIDVEVMLNVSGGVSGSVYSYSADDGNDTTLSWVWLQIALTETDAPPLYVNRTYKGSGIYQPMPTTQEIYALGGMDNSYLDLFKLKGGPCLWVGEPET